MIKHKQDKVVIENSHNGKGIIELIQILSKSEMRDKVKVFSKVIIKPNASIGYHQHIDESEAYYILKGTGIFLDEEGKKVPIKSGDVCLINSGESHGIENTGDENIEMLALVYPS